MRVFFSGDVVGRPGRRALASALPVIAERWGGFDFVVINCENAASGKGMTEKVMEELFALGVDGMTSGNHIWDKNIFYPALASETRVLRPANYPPGSLGGGYTVLTLDSKGRKGSKNKKNCGNLGLLNLQGRVFMPPLDCPFRTADAALDELKKSGVTSVLVDFHAEATSEKKALALYLDGRVSAVVGTHTHVQTADERLLPGGAAYITDVGMTGGHGGVIGVTPDTVMSRFLTGMPVKHDVCDVDPRVNAVVIDIDDASGRALSITRIDEPAGEKGGDV
jgi:metallophosphoesterase (TIGR00282 family)